MRLLVLLAGAGMALPVAAQTGAVDWASKPYEYMIVDQDVRMVLEEFGHNNGVPISVSPAVQGRVRGNLPGGTARVFLDALSKAYGLEWYFDGYGLAVSAQAESRSRLVELHDVPFDQVLDQVRAGGLYDARYQLRPGPAPAMASVAGPPRFVEAVAETIAAMSRRAAPQAEAGRVMYVYRGSAAAQAVPFPR